jgi:RimJ/RimL family protein N-acetyltransferase
VYDGVALLPMEEARYLSATSAANIADRGWMQYTATSLFPAPMRKMRAFLESHREAGVAFTAHDLERDGAHVGNAYLLNLDFVHRTAETSMMIFKEHSGRRFDVRTGLVLLKYGFLRLGMRRIWAASINPAAVATNYGMGMTFEARLRRASLVQAGVRDSSRFSILRGEFLKKFGGALELGNG